MSSTRSKWLLGCGRIAMACSILGLSGCAIHYYDKQTGTEHLWGFGHMKMRAVPRMEDKPPFTNAVVAIVTGVRTVGAALGAGEEYAGVVAGWDSRSRLIISSEDSQFYLAWPTNSTWLPLGLKDRLFTVRVGLDFPFTNDWYAPKPNSIPQEP